MLTAKHHQPKMERIVPKWRNIFPSRLTLLPWRWRNLISFETLVDPCQATRRHLSEARYLNTRNNIFTEWRTPLWTCNFAETELLYTNGDWSFDARKTCGMSCVQDNHVLARMFAAAMDGWLVGWMYIWMYRSVLPLYFWMNRLGVTFTHSSYFILCLCLSVTIVTCVNFAATDSVFIRCCGKLPHTLYSHVILLTDVFVAQKYLYGIIITPYNQLCCRDLSYVRKRAASVV
jgi:hypothetical protein